MTQYYYIDTSALVRLFIKKENGHQKIKDIYSNSNNVFVVCELTDLEFNSALRKKLTNTDITQNITQEEFIEARKEYAEKIVDAVDADKVIYIPIESSVYTEAINLVLNHGLRSLDAIQLQTALAYQGLGMTFVTADNKLAKAASNYFEVINLNDYVEQNSSV